MTFAIGQQVICIKPRWRYARPPVIVPKFMQIYTVRAYCPCASKPSILLVEIVNSFEVTFVETYRRGEPSFAEYYFRALERLEELEELETVV